MIRDAPFFTEDVVICKELSHEAIGERSGKSCQDPKARECLLSPRKNKVPSVTGVEESKKRLRGSKVDRGPDYGGSCGPS